jgi:pilus assembly protein CpaF
MNNLELFDFVKKIVTDKLESIKNVSDDDVHETIIQALIDIDSSFYTKPSTKAYILQKLFNSMRRLDVLQPLIEDKSITEIMVNGPNNIFIEKHGRIIRADVQFSSEDKLRDVINNIVAKVNRTINESSPIVDARLQDGSRVNAVVPPITLSGATLTIRKFPEKPMTSEELVRYSSITEEVSSFLQKLVCSKYNIFVCGGTGSGKTTFLNALSNFIPKDERIITIEDSAELQIVNVDNIVKLETRNSNSEGKGEISIRDLIKASLRMRPERIIVGEVRGSEAFDMLQAMNTGHDGSLSTGHANSAKDMINRLETMVSSGSTSLPLETIRKQIASAIDIIIHLSRLRDKSRRTMEISEIVGYENGEIVLNPLFLFAEMGEESDGRIIGSLQKTSSKMIHTHKFKLAGINYP